LTERLLERGDEVIAVDSLIDNYSRESKLANLARFSDHPRCTSVADDLVELDLAPLLHGVDYVFHLAALPGVRASWGNAFDGYLRNNVLATQRLLEAAGTAPVTRIVFASSSSVYGDSERYPTPETAAPRPISPYGVTKLAGEHLCSLYWRQFALPVVSLRFFSAYGPRQRPDMAFHIFIRALLSGEAIEVYGDGQQSRDFTYVTDIVEANLLAAERGHAGRVYNIGAGSETALNDAIEMAQALTGRRLTIHHRPNEGGDARRTAADITRARRELGYRPRVSLEEGLVRQIAWAEDLYRLPLAPAPRNSVQPSQLRAGSRR
jgi:UDP-glucose 4-epimerase